MMDTYFIIQDDRLPLIGVQTYSTGDGLDLSQRYGYDYSRKPQSLVYRRRNTAMTATVQLVYSPVLCDDYGISMMDYTARLEQICGQRVGLVWCGKERGDFVIQSIQFSGTSDTAQIFSQVAVSISMCEGYVRREHLSTDVRTL